MLLIAHRDGCFMALEQQFRCALGRGGVKPAAQKREGDGACPAGVWPLRQVLFRPDRGGPPATALATSPLSPDDGWCDAPGDVAYNRPVKRPYPASHEQMWREDGLYDLVVVLGYNDDPPIPGMGSAIFLHVARPDYGPTLGCVALARSDLEQVVGMAGPGDALAIRLD